MSIIKRIIPRKILDSRGDFTLEVDVYLDDGSMGRASVPSGASKGHHEACRVSDVEKSIANAQILAKSIIGRDAREQQKIDVAMIDTDATANKCSLGANVVLAISLAVCEAAANCARKPLYQYISELSEIKMNGYQLPTPMFNIINGGQHADNNLPFQEFMIVSIGSRSFKQKVEDGAEVFHQLKNDLRQMNLSTNVGDEGGFAPRLNSNEEAIELITNAIIKTGHRPKEDMAIAIDVAASSIANLPAVTYPLSPIAYYQKITNTYPITMIEDGLDEDAWNDWLALTAALGDKIAIIGDDLFTTNPQRLQKGIQEKCANGIIIKTDQIGTLTETFKTIKMAKAANYTIIISHRSGETESTFISDLAVGVGADFIKTGAPSRGERTAKYNQLIRIEEKIVI